MRLLIVDDEPESLAVYRHCLDDHDVTICRDGVAAERALRMAVADEAPIAAAFVAAAAEADAARLHRVDPALSIVLAGADHAGGFNGLRLRKPLVAAEVAALIRLLAERDALAARIAALETENAALATSAQRALHVANHDALTEAPNRLAFRRALTARSQETGDFAVVMLDLDRFKFVNDTLGHLAGDALIREVCAVLQRAVPDDGLVARLGGDEFALLFDTADEHAALAAGSALVEACSTGFTVYDHAVQIGASAGVVVATDERRDPTVLLHCADQALNEAKRSGRGVAKLFAESLDESMRFRRAVERGLRAAIARDELTLLFQPIVARDRLEVVGFEALLRWRSAVHGDVPPETFIPIAEESNLIHELGEWTLRHALAMLAGWPGQYVSLNVSGRQFRRQDFVAHLSRIVDAVGVAPARLQIEITESVIFDDAEGAAGTLAKLHAAGFRVALDDFGTGYSSLHSIRDLALDSLKIDRAFIEGLGRERQSAAIVHSIIHLGRALGLSVVAEGVETDMQVQALRLAGASHMQGFFFYGPVDAERSRTIAKTRFLTAAAITSAA